MKRLVFASLAVILAMQLTSVSFAVIDCTERLLVLSAFPGEIDHLLVASDVDSVEQVDGRTFYIGTLEGNDVVLALSGIGLVNAEQTTRIALDHFRCGADPAITGIVFSGVSGGPRIGDVMIPARWTLDGATYFDIDPAMAAVADAAAQDVVLARATPVGDPACVGVDPDLLTTVEVEQPDIITGGDGASSDGFGERALPCFPGGGDVFGCTPCRAPSAQAPDVERTVTRAAPFIDPMFFFGYFDASQPPPGDFIAVDMETAAVAAVADESGIPFIAFRAASDGGGDPLNLPGFPFQFFYYRQLAANNAAAVTLAFLDEWGAQ